MSPANDFGAIVLAAGKGTRMRSSRPKVLHEILGRSMLGWVMAALEQAGCASAVLVLGHGREQVEAQLQTWRGSLSWRLAHQAEQRGTADAVRCALPCLGDEAEQSEPRWLLIVYGDVPCVSAETLQRLFDARVQGGIAFLSMIVDDPSGYGRVLRDADGAVLRIVEHKECSEQELGLREVNSGLYCVEQSFLRQHLEQLEEGQSASGRELYLTDLVELAATVGEGAVALVGEHPAELMGVNDRSQLAEAQRFLRQRTNHAWMLQGVSMDEPQSIELGPEVELSEDVWLEQGVLLRGRTRLARGVRIGAYCVLDNCVVEEGVSIEALSRHDNVRLRAARP